MEDSRQEQVAAYVRHAVMTGELCPGDRLIEQNLAAEMQMSRGPVRDALRQLEQEGLVQLQRNRGAVVSTLGLREAYEFYQVRGHLESLAVRLAREHMRPADIARLGDIADQMTTLASAENGWLRAAELDLAFHTQIVSCSHNQSLIHTYAGMNVKINALFMTVKQFMPNRLQLMPERHRKVVDVFATGDWWRAETVIAEHWYETAAQFKHIEATLAALIAGGATARDG